MIKIVSCIDYSKSANGILSLTRALNEKVNSTISLLHVVSPHFDEKTEPNLVGNIGFSTNTKLLEEITQIDEKRGRLEQQRGELVLNLSKEELVKRGVNDDNIDLIHKRGSLVEIVVDIEADLDVLVMGKYGEYSEKSTHNIIGSNIENVARSISKPLFIATNDFSELNKVLLCFDGSDTASRALKYVKENEIFKKLEITILVVGDDSLEHKGILSNGVDELKNSALDVSGIIADGDVVADVVSKYCEENNIDLIVAGAYGHSRIRNLILGSNTTAIIKKSNVSVLLVS